ncbi:hypothetical protein RV13_GL001635 [Enterococcus raffinosus]|nr:hypothetical protein RV13_GL001635 [Enterococcus raffinosus]
MLAAKKRIVPTSSTDILVESNRMVNENKKLFRGWDHNGYKT